MLLGGYAIGLRRAWGLEPAEPQAVPLARRRAAVAWPGISLVTSLLLLLGLLVGWRPAVERCAAVTYSDSSPLTPFGPAWATSPDPAAPRGSPDVAAFGQLCTYHASNLGQVIYTYYPTCKWTQVDANYPLVQATDVLRYIELSPEDSPWLHTSHDMGLDLAVDPASSWLVLGGGGAGALLHVEAESGPFPPTYRPVAGDRVTVAGRWIYDCGHDANTEIHPAAVVASEREEWRADAPGGPGKAHLVRVWMNSAPGVVHVPLAPVDLRAGFPALPPGLVVTPIVQVVAGPAGDVQWTVSRGSVPEASLRIAPTAHGGPAYFEVLLGYREAVPAAEPPVAYTLTFDRLAVLYDLRGLACNTTGLPFGPAFPELGFPGSNHWTMQLIAGQTWTSLLAGASVESGHTYSLTSVPPVPIFAPGSEHLRMMVTGYAENDPSSGVELASGSIEGPRVLSWDAGSLTSLCCGTLKTFTPSYGGWTLSYRVSRTAR